MSWWQIANEIHPSAWIYVILNILLLLQNVEVLYCILVRLLIEKCPFRFPHNHKASVLDTSGKTQGLHFLFAVIWLANSLGSMHAGSVPSVPRHVDSSFDHRFSGLQWISKGNQSMLNTWRSNEALHNQHHWGQGLEVHPAPIQFFSPCVFKQMPVQDWGLLTNTIIQNNHFFQKWEMYKSYIQKYNSGAISMAAFEWPLFKVTAKVKGTNCCKNVLENTERIR